MQFPLGINRHPGNLSNVPGSSLPVFPVTSNAETSMNMNIPHGNPTPASSSSSVATATAAAAQVQAASAAAVAAAALFDPMNAYKSHYNTGI